MDIKKSLQGALIASAVSALFVGAPASAKSTKAGATVKCAGVNECSGKGSCAGADNTCKSHNNCKGKGWVEAKTAKECTKKGGTVVADNKAADAPKAADSKN